MTFTSSSNDEKASPNNVRQTLLRRHLKSVVLSAVVGTLFIVGLFAYLVYRHREQSNSWGGLRASGIPSNISTQLADRMALSPVPVRTAPTFTLIDQRGRLISLSSFNGRAVILEFMDPHCVDICPIVSQEFVDAYHDLGAFSSRVVFIAVNVNPYYVTTTDVAKFSAEHGLNAIPSWHFLTGSINDLKSVWQNYGITVEAPHPGGDIVHTSTVYFIDSSGRERYIATPLDERAPNGVSFLPPAQISSWGEGIALMAQHLIS